MTKDNSTGKDKEFYSKGKQMFDSIEVMPTERKASMTELSEDSLEAMLIKIRKHLDETGDRISLIPTHFILRPSDLKALGLTVDDVTKMIKEKST